MKMLMLIQRLTRSGAPKMFLWVASKLSEAGNDVHIITLNPQNKDTGKIEVPDGIRWSRLDLSPKKVLTQVKAIRKIIDTENPDCCLSFLLDANVTNTFACLGKKTKSVIAERNDPYQPGYYKLKIAKHLFRFSDGAVFQLTKARDFYTMLKAPTAVIPNPVIKSESKFDLPPFEERKNAVVNVSRIDFFQKRQDLLVKAFKYVHDKHPDWQLDLWGCVYKEEDGVKLKALIKELGLEDVVYLKGKTGTPLETISQYKIYGFSSDFEGIPNALIEPMTIGLPCVSTDCRPGGAALLIKDGVNGLLVPKSDEVALGNAINKLIESPDLCMKLGNKARKIVDEFSEDKIAKMWVDYIYSICAKK